MRRPWTREVATRRGLVQAALRVHVGDKKARSAARRIAKAVAAAIDGRKSRRIAAVANATLR